MLLEVCIDDPEGYDAALAGGADRIELCSALALGGLSPLPGMIALAQSSPVPVMAMVRPRAGNFVWTAREEEAMLHEIDAMRTAGFAGVVLGANLPDGRLDAPLLARLIARAKGMKTTLHRAFDIVPDLAEAVDTAAALGFDRILTSGRATNVILGAKDIAETLRLAQNRIQILVGGGVNAGNVAALLAEVTPDELHASGSTVLPPPSGKLAELGFEYVGRKITLKDNIAAIKALI